METDEKTDWDPYTEELEPPLYTTNDSPPDYSPPTSYRIGSQTLLSPLVQVAELRAHLSLLRAFKNLRNDVEEANAAKLPEGTRTLDQRQRWAWFVGLAVDRFVISTAKLYQPLAEKSCCRFLDWVLRMQPLPLESWIQQEMPPLDVMMVWHAYLLNPTYVCTHAVYTPTILRLLFSLGGTQRTACAFRC